jgi:GH15 family glucan-1,4-alpha-glucosidase
MSPDIEADRSPRYPPIGDYGLLSDCHSCALVSRYGSIDWCCMPRLDSASLFGRLLGWDEGGYCLVAPVAEYRVHRRYRGSSLILETNFITAEGEVRLLDFMPMREGGRRDPHRQVLRIAEGVSGEVELLIRLVIRFDYGAIKPWLCRTVDDVFQAVGGNHGLLISSNLGLRIENRHDLAGRGTVKKGERVYLSLLHRQPEALSGDGVRAPTGEELDSRLEETIEWWRRWSEQGDLEGPYREQCLRSALVLKGLTQAPTGAIAAAATTSLPEAAGGSRNWDYRYTWVRDSVFTVRSLAELGYVKEADGFRRFVERSAAGSAEEVQVLYAVDGRRRLYEHDIAELPGYQGASPVRIGNAAAGQIQLDLYGELLDLAFNWHRRGNSPDEDYWEFIVELVEAARTRWRDPDHGIWEMRGEPRHFVHSKALCWSALDCGIRLAEELDRRCPLDEWRQARDDVRRAIEERGYDSRRGVFTQSFGSSQLDASLLLLPVFRFVPFDDERMQRTADAIDRELCHDGLILRYAPASDNLEGTEGAFIACTFWLVEVLARQGRVERARLVYEKALASGNDLGLFAEEFEPTSGQMLGNFPQGLTHLSQITAAVALAEAEARSRRKETT